MNPADGELGWSAALFLGEGLDLADQLEIVLESGLLEAWEGGDVAELLEVCDLFESTGEDLSLEY